MKYINKYVDDMLTVSDNEIASAIIALIERAKEIVEPAGAAGLAAADKGLVVDISDENAVTEALRAEKPDFADRADWKISHDHGGRQRCVGLPGISRDMAELCTDKFKFHTKLNEMGLRKCRCYTVFGDNPELAYPAILKPRYGSGSRGILCSPAESSFGRPLRRFPASLMCWRNVLQGKNTVWTEP